jgi:DUF4097 and DUF4098 domain-containing protein YvlB
MTPARWTALAIGVPVVLSLIGFTGFDLVAQIGQASFGVNYALPARQGHLSVGVDGGNITVRPGQGDSARLVGRVKYSLVRPVLTRDGGNVSLRCRLVFGNCGLDATLSLPAREALTLSTGGGDTTVSGLRGGVDLSSGGGNVSVHDVAGTVRASTGGGDIDVDGLAGTLVLSTDGGNIGGAAITSPDVTAHTGGGDITLTFTSPPKSLDITSDGGNITVVLPRNDVGGYAITYNTGGGNTHVPANIVNGSSPDKVTAQTGGGDITITEASS